ncbi:MAG TPA: hypothetical protein VNU97_06035 [Rhizomicrobium sp.]|jgi:preprotein translocase subunit SecD|nr:hypothetical protein [Rhizomicrobium sp.]
MKWIALSLALSLAPAAAAEAPPATLEMRLVVDCTPGAVPLPHDNQGVSESLCLSPDLILDRSDVVAARTVHTAYGSDAVRITIDDDAVARLSAATAKAAGARGRIAIVYDGKLVSAPMVMDPITGNQVEIDLGLSGDRLDAVAADLRRTQR